MISSCMFSNAPPAAKARQTIGIAMIPAIPSPANEPVDPIAERAGLVDDTERAAHEKDEGDDGDGVNDPVGDRDDRLEGADRVRGDAVIGAGDDDFLPGGRIITRRRTALPGERG